MGRQAADLLQQAIEQEGLSVRNVVLPSRLIVRGSTGVPPEISVAEGPRRPRKAR
jgi:LacI family transcriptional regulator